MEDFVVLGGWNPDVKGSPEWCAQPAAILQLPQMRNAKIADIDFDTYFEAFYGNLVRQFQKEGTCAGQSGKNCWDFRKAFLAMLYPSMVKDKKRISVAGAYGAGRVEVGQSPGRWQGCSAGWVAQGLVRVGGLLLETLGLTDEQIDQDEQLALEYAASRQGIPEQYERSMLIHAIEKAPPVRTMEDLLLLQVNGVPVQTGSWTIPTGQVNSTGLSPCSRNDTGHATMFGGVRNTARGELKLMEFKYINSWSNRWAQNGACWISYDNARRILDDGDCWGYY